MTQTTTLEQTETSASTEASGIVHIYCGPCYLGMPFDTVMVSFCGCGRKRLGESQYWFGTPDDCKVCIDLSEQGCTRCGL